MRPSIRSPLAGLVLAIVACDGLLVDPADTMTLPVGLVLVADAATGPAEAFDAADRIHVLLRDGDRIIYDETTSFGAAGGDVRVPVSIDSELNGTPLAIEISLLQSTQPLFTGQGAVTPAAGETATAEITLSPVVASLQVEPGDVTLDAIGATVQFTGTALFATGDDIPGATIAFSAVSPGVIEVAANGSTRALAEGTAEVEARTGSTTARVTVTVEQIVTSVEFAEPPDIIAVGGALTFTVLLRDRNGFPVTERDVTWISSDPSVLVIDDEGVAEAVGTGTVTITATVDGVSSEITVQVIDPVPISPTGLMASARGTRVDLAWIDASNDESSFEVLRRAVGGSFALVATVPANNTTHIDQATAGTQFEYVVRACNAAGCSGNSTSAMAVTVPITPPNVGINLETDFTVTLSWDNVAHETLYRIDRDDFGDGQWYSGGGTDADVTVWASDPEDFYAPYASYRVMACNDAGCSPPSPPVFADIGEGSSPRSPFKKTANGAGRGGSR